MKIVYDTRWIRSREVDGIGQFTKEILKALLSLDSNTYILLYNDKEIKGLIENELLSINKKAKFSFYEIKYGVLGIKHFLRLPRDLKKLDYDLFFSPNYLISPFFPKNKYMVVVYDLIPMLFSFKQASLKWRIFYKFKILPRIIFKRALKILTISKNTAENVSKIFKMPENSLGAVYIAVGEEYHHSSAKEILRVTEKYRLRKPYFFYIGRFDPYKNISALIKAFRKLPKNIQESHDLIIGGSQKSKYFETLKEEAKETKLNGIKFIGFIDQADICGLYSGAAAFLFPSLYEGFGMPILEAMACGAPVITSNISSMPEVAGDAAILVNPKNIDEIKDAIIKLIKNPNFREELIEKGLKQVKKFSWQESARKLIKIFENLKKEKV